MAERWAETIDWERLGGLRLRARAIAEGVWAGAHRSRRRGAGLEFAGHRPYVPGDDLRWLDPRASLRSDALLVRQFETETERGLRLLLDASASMGLRSDGARMTKWEFAALLAGALARLAHLAGDPVGALLLGEHGTWLPPARGSEAYERLVAVLEACQPAGAAVPAGQSLERALERSRQGAARGSLMVMMSDLLELEGGAPQSLAALAGRGRQLCVVQVLDPLEAELNLEGPVRLRSPETGRVLETQAGAARAGYLQALGAHQRRYQQALQARGARWLVVRTDGDPVEAVRAIVGGLGGDPGFAGSTASPERGAAAER